MAKNWQEELASNDDFPDYLETLQNHFSKPFKTP